jgi:hypothetical protein
VVIKEDLINSSLTIPEDYQTQLESWKTSHLPISLKRKMEELYKILSMAQMELSKYFRTYLSIRIRRVKFSKTAFPMLMVKMG